MTRTMFSVARSMAQVSLAALLIALPSAVLAQAAMQGRWASDNDPVAAQLIELERQWATLACTPADALVARSKAFIGDFIADDFVGTSPSGGLYTKADMLTVPAKVPEPEKDCKVLGARVRYFGPDVAVIYGSESAILKGPDGKEAPRTLVWTDTLMKRGGKWQIVAVQDMVVPTK